MKKIENLVATTLVWIIYLLTYLMPVKKNKLTFVSYNSPTLTDDMQLIANQFDDKYHKVYLLKKFEGSLKGKFLYLFDFIKQTYHYNTSKIFIIDGNNFVQATVPKKSQVKVMQLWHATGAIKKFGMLIKRRYPIKACDAIFVASNYWKQPFAKAFNSPESSILPLGVAKTDLCFDLDYLDACQKDMLIKYPQLKDKKLVLYAPTFRGEGVDDINYFDVDLEYINENLGEDYILGIKLHPLVKAHPSKNIIDFSQEPLFKALTVCDTLISDYSAIIFEAAILDKRIILFAPDIQNYLIDRGLLLDYDQDLVFKKTYTLDDLVLAINNEPKQDLQKFKKKYLEAIDGTSALKISNYIKKTMEE